MTFFFVIDVHGVSSLTVIDVQGVSSMTSSSAKNLFLVLTGEARVSGGNATWLVTSTAAISQHPPTSTSSVGTSTLWTGAVAAALKQFAATWPYWLQL